MICEYIYILYIIYIYISCIKYKDTILSNILVLFCMNRTYTYTRKMDEKLMKNSCEFKCKVGGQVFFFNLFHVWPYFDGLNPK